MSTSTAPTLPLVQVGQRRERPRRLRRIWLSLRGNRAAIAGLVVLILIVLVAIFAPVVAPHDPMWQERGERLSPVGTKGEQSGRFYLLGTDALGRDVLSRIIYGSRVSLLIGFCSVALSAPMGILLGLVAGFGRRWVDDAIMRIADVQLAFPFILLAMSVIAVLGPSTRNIVLVLGISGWVLYARIVRAEVLRLKQLEFVQAAQVVGCEDRRIIVRHLLPNVLTPVIVLATFALAYMILLESSLSFLGLGVQPPSPTWGGMLNDARDYIATAWWISVMPGLAIMLTVLSVNYVGDWLRDLLDPREQLL